MKHSKTCPKCHGSEIYRVDGHAGAYGSGNNIMIGATIFSAVRVNRYLCGRCGYSEEWIEEEDLHRLTDSQKAYRI